jgi:glucose PTS system EIICB or EIICBA component
MSVFSGAFSYLQKIGKCMMLPVSVLPVAGILLGVGSANFPWLPQIVSQIMAQSGGAIFSNLPLLFAIGVAIGLTDNDGVAALASTVGFAVFLATMGVCAKLRGIETATNMGTPTIETGVFGGIIVGLIAASVFSRFYKVQLPAWLFRRQALGADHHGFCRHRRRGDLELCLAADWQRDQRFL